MCLEPLLDLGSLWELVYFLSFGSAFSDFYLYGMTPITISRVILYVHSLEVVSMVSYRRISQIVPQAHMLGIPIYQRSFSILPPSADVLAMCSTVDPSKCITPPFMPALFTILSEPSSFSILRHKYRSEQWVS
jgi:hypothetical protein